MIFFLQFPRTCPYSLICLSVASCSCLKGACLFLTLRQYLRLWFSCSLACWFVFQLGWPVGGCLSPVWETFLKLWPSFSKFFLEDEAPAVLACMLGDCQLVGLRGSGQEGPGRRQGVHLATRGLFLSKFLPAEMCPVAPCHIISLQTPGSQLTHLLASKLCGPLWSSVIFSLVLCLYAFIAFIHLLSVLASRERIDCQEQIINSIFQSAIFP